MAFAETQELVVKLSLKGDLSSKLRGAIKDVSAFDKATSRTQKSLGKFGSNIGKAVTVGLAATAGGFLAVVDAAKDYESAFAGVRKTVTATDAELADLSASFRKLSKEIPISAAELARLGEAGGALGIDVENLEEFVRVTALLGVTTDLSSDQAAESLGVLSNVLHLTGKEYSAFASALVALGNAGASTESDIIAIAERAGAAGELIGVSTQQVLGFSSAVASLGIESEAGGTAIQKFFIDSAKFTAQSGDELKILAKTAGLTGKAFKKAFDKDAGAALQRFLKGLGKLPQAKQLAILEDLGFNDARITRTLLGLANNTELVGKSMDVANQAFAENTALTKEAGERFKTFDSQLQITKNTLTDIGITIGSKLLPKLTPLLQKLNTFITAHQGDIEKFGDDLAKGFENFANAIGEVDWTPFIDGLRITSGAVKTIIGVFQSLPADVQKLIVAGVAINKATGGLITSVTKDLAGIGLKLFLDKGQTPANPLWVAMAGGGLPGGTPVPTGGAPAGGGFLNTLVQGLKIGLPMAALAQTVGQEVHADLDPDLEDLKARLSGMDTSVTAVPTKITASIEAQGAAARADAQTNARIASDAAGKQVAADSALLGATNKLDADTLSGLSGVINQVNAAKSATVTATSAVRSAVAAAGTATARASAMAAQAIREKDLSVTVLNRNTIRVSIRDTLVTTAYSNAAGPVAS